MGQTGRSFIVGKGKRPPVFIYEQPSSCPRTQSTAPCDATSGLLNTAPNPWVVKGALVRGPVNQDDLTDSRLSYQTAAQVRQLNASFSTLLSSVRHVHASLQILSSKMGCCCC